MSTPVPPLMRSLRALLTAVVTALAIPVVLAAGAALPPGAVLAGVVLAVFVGAVVRTLSWVAAEPTGDRANSLAITSGLGAGAAAVGLSVFAVLAGPVVLVLIPLVTAAGAGAWWIGRPAL
ncbi:hypothetical protein [Pseudonocardia parietis]|uniref:Uncharacterized protein n=1 Tax=Pseudonocardia parietis TaxID=570936 RepID=A0ABS4VM23_9PSEU|nr:hypothetical protein [Pseudonocardia parietis]MBP2364966.1 hypothetical protein [Pseudonocardia parietis]